MQKQELIESLKRKGFSGKILDAFSKVPRENFIPLNLRAYAYEDNAFPIGKGQTISQPYTIATMLEMLQLKKGQKVLEVGSGSGYVLALLSEIVGSKGKVCGIDIVKELVEKSKSNLKNAGYNSIEVYHDNGSKGLPEKSPFDRILISAALEEISKPLIIQLKEKGILVAPLDDRSVTYSQTLISFQKQNHKLKIIKEKPGFVFVRFVE